LTEPLKPKLKKVVIYGGHGFVGSKIAQYFAEQGHHVSCLSRRGQAPKQLQQSKSGWVQRVNWLAGDASKPCDDIIASADLVISTVGSPPLPTFSAQAFKKQYQANGASNCALLAACAEAGVKDMIFIGALIPSLLRRKAFAYFTGKRDTIRKATSIVYNQTVNKQHCRIAILQPSMIYGTRYTQQGFPLPLGVIAPISDVMQCFNRFDSLPWLKKIAASSPVAVDNIARYCLAFNSVNNTVEEEHTAAKSATSSIHIVSNQQLLNA